MLFGQSEQRVLGEPVTQLLRGDDFHDQLQVALHQRDPQSIRENVIELSSGDQITIDCVVTPLWAPAWKNQLLLEIQRVDRQLRIVREEQMIHQQQAIRELVRGIAHEIKNPLGGLRGAAQLLESELDNAELKEYTQIIISEADRLKNLVNGLLGPRSLPRPETVNIHEVLEHVRQLVSTDMSIGIHIVRDYDPSIPEFQGDRDQLVQVVLNIVSNAVRALCKQGIIQDICDNGPGVPSHLRDKLFLPMVSGHAEGSGLGLSIAQSLVRRHNGLIQCESVPGYTCFSILIPLENGYAPR